MNLDKRLLRQARIARVELIATVGLGLAGGVLLVLQALTLSRTVSRVFLQGANLTELRPLLLHLAMLALLRAAANWGGEVCAQQLAGRVKSKLRQELAAHLLRLGPNFTQREHSGELSNTITEGVEALDAYLSQYLPQLVLSALIPLTILFFVFPLDPLSGIVLLITAPLIPFFMWLIGQAAEALTNKQWGSLSRMSAHFLDLLQGLTTLKLLGQSRAQIQSIANTSNDFRQATMGVLRVAFLSALVLEMLATISTAVVAVQIGLRLLYGRLDFEGAFFVLLLTPEFYLPLRMLGTRFHAGRTGVAAAQRIFEVLDTQVTTASPRTSQLKSLTKVPEQIAFQKIRFEGVSYAYDDNRRPALHNFSLEIRSGQQIALVGPSGSGKSTVASLLLRFMEPESGSILVAPHSLHEFNPSGWRKQIAWVPQTPYLFNASVRENVQLARPEAEMDQVIHACKLAHAHQFIQALPQHYETRVGDRGSKLSGGQAQRIALARAFLKDAPLLVLDEATANLDPGHEELIQQSIQALMRGRTVLVIAHRLNTVTKADQIVVMDQGRIVEQGSFDQLVSQTGLFRQLVHHYQPPNRKHP